MKRTATPDVHDFPDPHRWATWRPGRNPQFKTHATLGIAKSAVTVVFQGGIARDRVWIYEWTEESGSWVERFFIETGERKSNLKLFQTRASSKTKRPTPQKAIDAAIASIVSEASNKE